MFKFIFKRRFVRDVLFVLSVCFDETKKSQKPSYDKYYLHKEEFLERIDDWLTKESDDLDLETYSSMSNVGMATHRACVWVGVYLAKGAYTQGSTNIPKSFLKKFFDPAHIISDEYFLNLRSHSSNPFSKAFNEHFDEALDKTG